MAFTNTLGLHPELVVTPQSKRAWRHLSVVATRSLFGPCLLFRSFCGAPWCLVCHHFHKSSCHLWRRTIPGHMKSVTIRGLQFFFFFLTSVHPTLFSLVIFFPEKEIQTEKQEELNFLFHWKNCTIRLKMQAHPFLDCLRKAKPFIWLRWDEMLSLSCWKGCPARHCISRSFCI